MNPLIIDISHWQPDPDWAKLKANGTLGVILKATEGTGYVDPTFRSRYDAAIKAGLAVSTYHFFKAGNVQTQMNNYLNTVKPRQGERMVLDHEEKASLSELESAVSYLLTDSRKLQITIYSGHLIKEQLGSKNSEILAANTSLWIAQYTSAESPTWPGGTWPDWSLWQYTDKATAAGIAGAVDGNRFNGSDANALKWLNPAGAEPVPTPEPPPPEPAPDEVDVVVSIQVASGVSVAVLVNDEEIGRTI
jgi:lysozyme